MSPERESRGHADHDYDDPDYGEEIPRSMFSTTWFRALLVVVVLAVVGVLALPYLLDWVGPTRLTPAAEQMRPDAAKGARMAKAPAPGRAAKTQLVAVSGGPYWVQVGAFHAEAHAKALAARLRGADFPAEVVAGGGGASAARAEPAV